MITTAQVPGRRPPLLVTADAVRAMAPGSVIVDMGASPLGGNVAGSVPGETIVTPNGVTIIGAQHLAASVPTAASNAYSRNISALLLHLVSRGRADDRHHRRDPGRGGRRARRRGRPPRRPKLLAAEASGEAAAGDPSRDASGRPRSNHRANERS